ncbi:MAG: hypothetical protein Q8S73_19240 [Deltaproteobacteria bacterium]|nr:hypothetical protein [Myxococcales bacterium]MDP3216252.1 hypothetical protein [Deltaproteobacteria bacterium]
MTTAIMSASQRLQIARAVRANERRAAREHVGELNVVPFLDIVMNVLLFVLATTATLFTASITPAVPMCCGHARGVELATVHVTPGGYVVATPSGFVDPGCRGMNPRGALTVPLRDGRHDPAALSRCLGTLRADNASSSAFHGPRTLQVSAVGAVPYGELVRAIDAVRETRPGAGDLFPDVTLGAMR